MVEASAYWRITAAQYRFVSSSTKASDSKLSESARTSQPFRSPDVPIDSAYCNGKTMSHMLSRPALEGITIKLRKSDPLRIFIRNIAALLLSI